MTSLACTFVLTAIASALLTVLVRRIAVRFGILDYPDGVRKRHPSDLPLLGGVAVYLAVVIGLVLARRGWFGTGYDLDELAAVVTAMAGFVCFFGSIDDYYRLNPRLKLLLQTCSILPPVLAGFQVRSVVFFGDTFNLGWLSIPLTVFWLLGCINAINLLDGMDGLASVVGLAAAMTLGVIAGYTGNGHVTAAAVVLAGALAGFFLHNRPPASIFLGDSGSMVIGLILGILGIQSTLKTSTTLSITAPLVVMTFPIFDTFLALVRRRLTGRPFDSADRQHIHHRLLDRGMSPWVVLGIIGALCLATGIAATAATIVHSDLLAWATAISLVILVVRLRLFGHYEWTLAVAAAGHVWRAIGEGWARCWRHENTIRSESLLQPPAPREKIPDVDVGVVYTYERAWMPRLVSSLAAAGRGVAMRLVLVDNASADGVEQWARQLPGTIVVRNPRRLSYAANINRILRAATARYALVINTDVYFDPAEPCVLRMVRFMDSHPQCGVAGCALYHEDGQFAHPARRFQNLAVILARRCGLGRVLRRVLDRYLYRDRPLQGTWQADWLCGAFLILRREALAEVGPFDAGFGKYFEDVDICLRMARAGWSVMYHGATYCYHLERRGSKNAVSADALRHLRAYLRWHWKWGFVYRPPTIEPRLTRRAA